MAGSNPPPKPWERAGTSSGPAPFKPASGGSTRDIIEASGTAKPGEVVSAAERNVTSNVNSTISWLVPSRPWQQQGYGFVPYLEGLSNTQLRLVTIYANRISQARSDAPIDANQ